MEKLDKAIAILMEHDQESLFALADIAEERARQHQRTFYEKTAIRHRFTPLDTTNQYLPLFTKHILTVRTYSA